MSEPTTTFTDFGVEAVLADALRAKGIVTPFPIQELTLPMALKGADLIGQARTGTGKTLAFGLPLLQRIDPSVKKTQALVIVPTRELCLQVADDLTVGADRGVTSIAIYGGVGYEEQIEALTSGVHVVIGTPGRTLDHLGRRNLDLSAVHTVVLDEADEMLDMGFLPDVERLLTECPEERQTLLFSATMPAVIVKLARRFMSKPTFMRAEAEERETAPTVDQHFLLVHRMDKPRVLARILQSEDRGGAFVFTRTKNMADRLVRELDDLKVSAIAVHGDLRQTTREKNLDRFRAGKADVLVATEVAARGLDVDNVTHVFNYDCPDDEKMYLHRIGRTARAGNKGVAVTFAEFNEVDRLNVIRKAVQADTDVAEVFSTSDALTEMFDLPEETPWDHMARGGGSSSKGGGSSRGGSSSQGGGSSKGGSSSKGDRRTSSSDGRNKSRRGSDGSRPASRDRTDRRRSSDEGRDDSSSSPESSSRESSSRERTRTRTRTRSRDTGSDRDDASRRDDSRRDDSRSSSDKGDGASSERSRSTSSKGDDSSSGRTRARTSRSRDRSSSSQDGGGSSSGRNRSSQDDSSRSSSNGSSKGGSSRGGGSKGGGGRSRSSSGGSGSGSSSKGRSGSGNGSRGRSNGGGGGNGDGTVRTTRRGEPARGDGTPRPRRRVAVEHLP